MPSPHGGYCVSYDSFHRKILPTQSGFHPPFVASQKSRVVSSAIPDQMLSIW